MSMLRDFVFVERGNPANSTAVRLTQGDTRFLPSFRPPKGETLRAACLTIEEIRLQGCRALDDFECSWRKQKSLGPEPQGPSCPFIGQGQVSGSRPGRLQSRSSVGNPEPKSRSRYNTRLAFQVDRSWALFRLGFARLGYHWVGRTLIRSRYARVEGPMGRALVNTYSGSTLINLNTTI